MLARRPTSAFAGSTACTTRPRARASITPTARSASSVTVCTASRSFAGSSRLSGASGPTSASCNAPSSAVAASAVSCAGRCPARTAASIRAAISPEISRRLASRDAETSTSTGSARMPQASLRCDSTCHGDGGNGGGQRRGRPGRGIRRAADRGQFVARDLGDQFGNQLGLGGEIAIDGAGRDIGADRDRGDLHRGHAALGRGVPRRRQNGAAPRGQPLHDLMGSPIDHGALSVPGAPPGLRGACQNAHAFNVLSNELASPL